ncbi:hypothetical protein DICVIV_02583, partial [Dictyocaulus viviparus]
ESSFHPKKVLVLSKITRYEFEKHKHPKFDDEQLQVMKMFQLRRRGTDYYQMLSKHRVHCNYLQTIQEELEWVCCLRKAGMESRVVQRFDYTEELIDWADVVMTAGGDGTFLRAASRIHGRNKPVIGINTDPQGWLYRQRIRITLTGDPQARIGDSFELYDHEINTLPTTLRRLDTYPTRSSLSCHENEQSAAKIHHEHTVSSLTNEAKEQNRPLSERISIQLPVLALNEVFIGESLSSRVSYYEIQIDDGKMTKQKSSGIAICTGTGSTSWYFNINKLTEQCVSELLQITSDRCGVKLPIDDKRVVSEICAKFNEQLIFKPDLFRMAYTVRDPIFNATFPSTTPRGLAEKIRVKSRGYDAHLVIDGGVSYRFNDGTEALVEMHDEDALRTVVFR